jgi:outer membrane receptor for ferrienterochelin and colicin
MTDGYNFYRDLPSSEFKTSLRADYRMGDSARLVVGGEYVRDTIRVYPPAGQPPDPSDYLYYWSFYPDSTGFEEDNHTFSGFGECNVRTPLANVTAGMRYDKHSLFGGAFAPRFAATKEMGKFHLKGLASGGYRVPGMSTIYWYTNNELKPEISRTYEVEAGYEPAPGTQLNVNVFNVSVRRPIVYDNGYSNDNPSVGSRGAEVECRWRTAWGYLNSSYSYYYAYLNKGEVYAALDAQGNPVKGATQGLPTHKASLNAHIKVAQGLSLNPGALYIGRRYSTNNISTGDPVNTAMPPAVIANLFVRQTFRDDRWDLGLGVFNITNRNYSMATAYQSDDADLAPALCREFVVKVGYSF